MSTTTPRPTAGGPKSPATGKDRPALVACHRVERSCILRHGHCAVGSSAHHRNHGP